MRYAVSALCLVVCAGSALARPPGTETTTAPLPPTPLGNAPDVLSQPIAPISGGAQQFTLRGVDPHWWTLFGSSVLNSLVDQALAANNDIAVADANLRQARELALAAGGAAYPSLDASYQVQRARVSNQIATPLADPNATLYTLHTAQLSVGYTLDVFGGIRSKIRSARAAAAAQRFRTQAAHTTVISNLVLAVIQRAAIVDQIEAAEFAISANRDVLQLLRQRERLGAVGAADVAAQEAALAIVEAALPPLQRARLHQEALISALTGKAPGTPLPLLPKLADITLPNNLPLSMPSEVVANRPDVRAAAAQMEGAAADVHTAIAARLPSFPLTASVGGSAPQFSDMFLTGNPFWSLIGGLAAPLFHGGTLRHQQRAAEAALEGSKAQYRATALQAFIDVSDALTALKTDADALDAASRGEASAVRSLGYARRQLELGSVGTMQLLLANSTRSQAATQRIQAQSARLADTVALLVASGIPENTRKP